MGRHLSLYLTIIFIVCCSVAASAQRFGVKTNILYLGTATPNLSFETTLGGKSTFELTGGYNPFRFSGREENKKIQHWLAMGEYRYWFCERFNGHLIGAHVFYSRYNMGGYNLDFFFDSGSRNYRYFGDAIGVGISYGYNIILSKRWNLEFSVGVGYALQRYDKYQCSRCGERLEADVKGNYFGPTKLGISFVYVIK